VNRRVTPDELTRLRTPRHDLVVEQATDEGVFVAEGGPFDRYERTVTVATDDTRPRNDDGTLRMTQTVRFHLAVPVWGALFTPLIKRSLRRPPPESGRQPFWAPPDALDQRAATVLGLLCTFGLFGGYLGTLLTQTVTYAAAQFGSSTGDQGATLAAVRIGVLFSLVLVTVADRKGRRLVLIGAALGACAVTALGALAPGLWWLGASQTVARGLSTTLALLISIVAVEEMPAGSRAYAVSVLTMTAALGAGLCVANLLYVDAAPGAWRVAYLVPLLALAPIWLLGRRLPETHRFNRIEATSGAAPPAASPGRAAADRLRGRSRFALLAVSGFCWSLFLAPAAQFLNQFLRAERGFSGSAIAVFTLATNTPGGIGIIVGGRLADVRGRRLVGAIGIIGGVGFTVVMYLAAGWGMWVASLAASLVGALAIPALAVYGPELFPTARRGRVNGALTVCSVAGSSVGLLVAGVLGDRWGGLAPAMALLALGPALVALLVLTRYPETAHRELEEINPEDARVNTIAFRSGPGAPL